MPMFKLFLVMAKNRTEAKNIVKRFLKNKEIATGYFYREEDGSSKPVKGKPQNVRVEIMKVYSTNIIEVS